METRVPGSPAPHDLLRGNRVLRFFPATICPIFRNGHRGDGASPALTRSSPRRCSPRIAVVVAHRTRIARATPRSDTRVSTARVVSDARKDAGYFPPPPPKYPYATLTKYNSPPFPRRRRRRFQTASTKGGGGSRHVDDVGHVPRARGADPQARELQPRRTERRQARLCFTAVGAHGRPVRVTRDAYAIFSTRVQRAVLVTVRDWQRCQHGHPALILRDGQAHVQTAER